MWLDGFKKGFIIKNIEFDASIFLFKVLKLDKIINLPSEYFNR